MDAAAGHFRFARLRRADQILVEAKPPQDAAASGSRGFATVRTVIEDMPFLYDSVGMAVRNAGTSIDWTVHPVLRVKRDGKGALAEVLGAAGSGEGGQPESLIHIECEALARAEDYAALEARLRQVLGEVRQVVRDFQAMRERLTDVVARLERVPKGGKAEEFREAQDFLRWLDDHRFTFLGYSE